MEQVVQELQIENAELCYTAENLKLWALSQPKHRPRSRSCTPPRRQPRTSSGQRCRESSSSEIDSSSQDSYERGRKPFRRYKKTKERDNTPLIDGHTPFQVEFSRSSLPRAL
ncbi:hypothetical protein PIB30_056430 [Stylosanthes scabra]|uniref:Uncharacterized protein n=1 Tax=Stylosanthes scabra TaxID=79078 RepID=A0ABU6RJV1_9FABA|nr:hypothetical protein [Stylosanthes scabra]